MGKCEILREGINDQAQFDIETFKNDTIAAVASLIGFPSKSGLKNIHDRIKYATKKIEKIINQKEITSLDKKELNRLKRELKVATKQLPIEERKYDDHNELFDLLTSQIFSSGEALQFDMNPMDVVGAWKVYFSKRQYGDVNPVMVSQSPRIAKSILTTVRDIDDKRNRLMKSGKLSKREVAMFPPEVIAITADKFGVMMKVIRKGLRLSDNEVSSVEEFANRFRSTLEKFKNNLVDNKAINKVLNLNNASAWGISGFRTRTDAPFPGADVVIVGEGMHKGVDSYKIKYYEEDGSLNNTPVWLRKEYLNANPSDVKKELIAFYLGTFVNETLDGRLRYITRGTVPPALDQSVSPPIVSGERTTYEEKYGKRVSNLLATMAEDYEYGKSEDEARMTPNVHFVRGKDKKTVYKYALFKTVDEGGRESYEAILLSKEPYKNEDPTKRENLIDNGYPPTEWDNVPIDEGWYRAENEQYYGRLRNPTTRELIPNSHKKAWNQFQRVENQPPREIIEELTIGETKTEIGYGSFWDTIREMRSTYSAVGDEVQSFNDINNQRSLEVRDRLVKRMTQKGMEPAEIKNALDKLFGVGGMRSKVFYTPSTTFEDGVEKIDEAGTGSVTTPTSYFMLKGDNYFPHVFKVEDLNTMINNAIGRVKEEIAESGFDKESDEYKRLAEGLEHLNDMRDRQNGSLTDDDVAAISRMVEANSNVHMKHISAWTDASYMRTDADVHGDYLKRIFGALHKNDLMADTVEAVDKLMQMEKKLVPEGAMDYLINRVKMSVGDSDTRATTFFGRETGYDSMANRLNKLPAFVRGGTKFTAESAEKLTKWINSFPSMRFLGSGSAAGNLTQIMNEIIAVGWGTFLEASKELNGEFSKNKWKSIVNGTGVLNILSMFNDIMLQGGDVEWNDFAMFPGTLIPSRNMGDLVRLLAKGRDNFILNGNKDIDDFLMNLEARSRGKMKESVRELQKLESQRKEILARKRGEYWDAFAIEEKDNSDAVVMKRFKKLIGEISDQKIRQMVTWKLSWHWDPLKKIFTFTGTEENLRATTAVMALLDAEKRGILGGDIDVTGSKGDYSIFKTDKARKIARDAVYNTQFGMTPQYMGEGFNGFGRAVFQYKTYAVQQMEHDFSVMRKFTRGSVSSVDTVIRINAAIKDAITRVAQGRSYNPADPYIDHEAAAAARLIFSRFSASVVASLIGVVAPLSWMMRKFGHQSFSMVRSFENPAMGIATRMIVWGSIIAMGADDDDSDDALSELMEDFSFLFLPVIIGMVGRDIIDSIDYLGED